MAQGTVKWYDPDKAYGFILPDDGGAEVFLPREALLGPAPTAGDRVMFTAQESPGRPMATQVQRIETGSKATSAVADHIVVPVHEEQLSATTHNAELGQVLIHKRTETEPVSIPVDLTREEVSVERVPINQPVDRAPEIRYEDDMMIVPVVAEEVVTMKRLILREEIRIRRRRVTETVPVHDTVRRQVVEVEGRGVPGITPSVELASDPQPPATPPPSH